MTARHHHYLSQCYLKGFTNSGKKNSQLSVIDFQLEKNFVTTPRNVGSKRDFNRVDIEGVDQNIFEKELSKIEGLIAEAIEEFQKKVDFNDEIRYLILLLIGLMAIRSPQRRNHWNNSQSELFERILALSLETKERWESQIDQMKADGIVLQESSSYEEVKKFFESKKYTWEIATAHSIKLELSGLKAVLPLLDARKWLVLKANKDSGYFVTSDQPVHLSWKDYKIAPKGIWRSSPGFGLKNTQVIFPLTKGIALIGEFDGVEGVICASKDLVASINTESIHFVEKQLYSADLDFKFNGKNGEILKGTDIVEKFRKK